MTTNTRSTGASGFEEAYTTFTQLAAVAADTFDLDNRITLAEAFEEFTRQGRDQVGELFPTDTVRPLDARAKLDELRRRLTRLITDASGLEEALRYTRTLDLIRALRPAPSRVIS